MRSGKASNTDAYDSFGLAVAVSGDTVVVGAINEDVHLACVAFAPGLIATDPLQPSPPATAP